MKDLYDLKRTLGRVQGVLSKKRETERPGGERSSTKRPTEPKHLGPVGAAETDTPTKDHTERM